MKPFVVALIVLGSIACERKQVYQGPDYQFVFSSEFEEIPSDVAPDISWRRKDGKLLVFQTLYTRPKSQFSSISDFVGHCSTAFKSPLLDAKITEQGHWLAIQKSETGIYVVAFSENYERIWIAVTFHFSTNTGTPIENDTIFLEAFAAICAGRFNPAYTK